MKRLLIALMAAAAALSMAVTAEAQEKLKACWVYVGPHNDGGYSEAHDRGRQLVDKELGDKVETSFVENVPEGPDAERAIERLARSGCAIIFTTSFGFMDPTLKVAAKYPDVKFEHATGFKTAPNVTTYNARFYQGRYIIGQIAAKMSKTGTVGIRMTLGSGCAPRQRKMRYWIVNETPIAVIRYTSRGGLRRRRVR